MLLDVDAEVLDNIRLSADSNVIALAAPAIAAAARPGQFVMVRTTPGVDPLLRRPFSIFEILRHPGGTPRGLTLLNKRVGTGTARLYDARPGDRVGCLGPLGTPFVPVDPPAEAWMVAGGVGLAPFVTLAEAVAARGARATLFYGARTADELLCVEIFERLGVRIARATEDGSAGEAGLVTAPLARALAGLDPDRPVAIYACGPTPMMRAVAALAATHGRPCWVSLEPVMGCGMGGCYSCVVRVRQPDGQARYVRSCLSGPVFDSRKVVWEELVH
jgi:dihydroorotate dehydrogenase electron transfer subunit